ncbi:phytoene desaturase [Ktedonobacter sp. SOSP1-85]|uniref:phytoene desaturase family protein n=1 Tax=Ktedonobacter sp. SOSP1-85 TaxID=2778367 RepID=UPI0019159796|nr:phytoene desaturase family protein [Ktedonobacter sp. SOSP1-85]GHO75808.1 phytoene desaturase [Ktedonobacter sp. SOSP1-85]
MSEQGREIIVIGAGIGGLSAAIHLATKGHRVSVLERQAQVGGKLNLIEKEGFAFDTGPSLITMPHVLRELFAVAGRRLEDYLELIPLEVTCRYFYRDGVVFNAWRDRECLAQEFARFNPEDGEAFRRFFEHARSIYEAAADPFLYHSLGSPLNIVRIFWHYVLKGHESGAGADESLSRRWRAVMAALSSRTLDQEVRRFFQDEHARQLFARYATYNGSSPYQMAAVYSLIPYVEVADGGWYPRGGMYSIARALEKLARELGVTLETNCEVKRIQVSVRRKLTSLRPEVRGIVLADGRVLHCDAVVANSDVVTTHSQLLSPAVQKQATLRKLAKLEPSCSGFVLLLGTDKTYPDLEHHNIFFSDDYQAEFADLFEKRVPIQNPTIYICATTRTDPTQAPPGGENLFILVNAPYLTKAIDWQREAPAYRERILDLLASYKQVDLSDLREHIVCEEMLTPEYFWQKYGSNAGSIYGLSSNGRMAPFTRPGNCSPEVERLYFVGGSTHPGGGIPLVMLSGRIVAELVDERVNG